MKTCKPTRRGCFASTKVVVGLTLVFCSTELIHAQGLLRTFNTGVDDTGAALDNYSVDSHYQLIASADPRFPGPQTVVVDDTSFPIGTGDWLASSATSKWIAPQGDQNYITDFSNGNAFGDYIYRTTIDLKGNDADLVVLVGQWTCDSLGTDVRINGVSSGNSTPGTNSPTNLREFHPLMVTAGFVPGTNTLDFAVTRVPWFGAPNLPTGMRVEFVVSNLPPPSLQIISAGNEILVSWPTNRTAGFALETSAALGTNQSWTRFSGTFLTIGDQHVAISEAVSRSKFFRLRKR